MPKAANLEQKLMLFSEVWSPRIVAEYNGNEVMVAKLKGAYHWHKHEDTDDFFYVLAGHLTLETENGNVAMRPGDLYVVPDGEEAHILLIEPAGEPNSGDPATAATKVWI